jgi:hypothetical protein
MKEETMEKVTTPRPYVAPKLSSYGSVSDLTMGRSQIWNLPQYARDAGSDDPINGVSG